MRRAGINHRGLTITVGCPGSGKTTWAKLHKQPDTLVVEYDHFRTTFFGGKQEYFDSPIDKEVKSRLLKGAAFGAMRMWRPGKFIISNTNAKPETAAPFLKFGARNQLPMHVVVFDAPLDLLLDRNDQRPIADYVPPDRIREMYADMQNPANRWWEEASDFGITVEHVNVEYRSHFHSGDGKTLSPDMAWRTN